MVLRQDGSVIWLRAGGLPVGMFPRASYEQNAVELDPGDLVVAYTDGVTEAISPAGEEWGVDGLLKAATVSATQSAEGIVSAIFASMDEFSRGRQTDDATVVVLRVH
jgi:sigma-B regulation protein RsbU (phosphoserine phosphatase)